jgi:hypothetical protein
MNVMNTSIASGGIAARTRGGPRPVPRRPTAARPEIDPDDCKQRTGGHGDSRPVS